MGSRPEHFVRLRELLAVLRRAILALVATVALVVAGAVVSAWVFIPAALSCFFAVGDAYLVWRKTRAEHTNDISALTRGAAVRADDAHAHQYGVDREVLPEGQAWLHIERDFEAELRQAIQEALSGAGPSLVMVSGPTKAGKTRAAIRALHDPTMQDAWLVEPRDGASVGTLVAQAPRSWNPLVILLDDIERYAAADTSGLTVADVRSLDTDRPVVLLATEGGRGQRIYAAKSELIDPVEQLRNVARRIEIPILPTPAELERIRAIYGEDFAKESERIGLGRRMVAANEIARKLTSGRHTPASERFSEGVAVMRAAIDWRRCGAQSPLTTEQLGVLYTKYLPDNLDPSDELLNKGLAWARRPLDSTDISLLRKSLDGTGRFEPYDLTIEVADAPAGWVSPDDEVVADLAAVGSPTDAFQMATVAYSNRSLKLAETLIAQAELTDDHRLASSAAFNHGIALAELGRDEEAEAAYRRAEERGHAGARSNLGSLLHRLGRDEEAEAAFRRAEERGDANAASNLGALLHELGRDEEAEAAFLRGEVRGDAGAAFNLGVLLHETGRDEEAEAAYRRAEEHGNASAAFNLGALLRKLGRDEEAEAAYRRAEEHGNPRAASNLGALLHELGRDEEAEAAFRRGDAGGDAGAAFNLGVLLHKMGRDEEAEAALRRGDERGDARAASNLGALLHEMGRDEEAEAAFRRGEERGDERAASNLGAFLHELGRDEEAEAAFRRGEERGDARAALNLGVLLHELGRDEEAEAAFRRGDAGAAFNLGVLLHETGRNEEAEAALRRAEEHGDERAALNLGVVLHELGRDEEAEAAFRRGDAGGDAGAAFNLGVLLHKMGRDEEAEAALRRAEEHGDERATGTLGVLLHELGRNEEAEAAFRRAEERDRSV